MNNQNNFPPNINPQLSSILAVIVGAAVADDFSVQEQSAIGNWLMLVSQYIITHAAQQNLIESRFNATNANSKQFKTNQNILDDVDNLNKAIKRIYEELEQIKNKY